ncbi:MAG TPA: ROK family protein [Vicinamibacterales bacterium]|nr:ROK family protein [Vicinamibacterales bacterium]
MTLRFGVDLGGTKIEAVALDGSREIARVRVATPRDDYEATLLAIANLVAALERRAGAAGTVGIGIPGALAPETGLVKNANSTWLIGRPLSSDLAARLGRPVRVANDANCFAVSEAADGAGAGAEVVFGVIVGTGAGAGVVVHGRVLTGANAVAGEWGHNPLPWPAPGEWPGPPCYCGKSGCVETFLSGPGLSRDLEAPTGRVLAPSEILAHAANGDADAEAALVRYEDRMARALAGVINVLDPDVIVLGGGLSNIDRLYDRVPRLWARHVFGAVRDARRSDHSQPGEAPIVRTRLLRAAHGDSSGVRGAAWLWPAEFHGPLNVPVR